MISKSFSPKFCKVDFMQKKSFIQSPGSHENSNIRPNSNYDFWILFSKTVPLKEKGSWQFMVKVCMSNYIP